MVRYADGPETDATVHIDAAPSEVWPLVTDIDLPSRFSEEFQGAEWKAPAKGPAQGARFVGRNHHPAIGEWKTTSTVVACTEPEVFSWAVVDPAEPAATWTFTLAAANGGTDLTFHTRLGPGWSGLSMAIDANPDKEERIVERRLAEHRANMLATLHGIKELAER